MKIISVGNVNCESIQTEYNSFYRFSNGEWIPKGLIITASDHNHELEAAYQNFKNPPFELKQISPKNIIIRISREYFSLNCTSEEHGKEVYSRLEQALNSLMEGK